MMKRSNKKYLYQSDSVFEESLMSDLTETCSRELGKAYLIACCKLTVPLGSFKLCSILLSLNSAVAPTMASFNFLARVVEFSETKYLLVNSHTSSTKGIIPFSSHNILEIIFASHVQ